MFDKQHLATLAQRHADVWWAGYDASEAGQPATACPYDPREPDRMNVWLSGHVTATDERNQGNAV